MNNCDDKDQWTADGGPRGHIGFIEELLANSDLYDSRTGSSSLAGPLRQAGIQPRQIPELKKEFSKKR